MQPSMIMEYSHCSLGKRCIVKTDDSYLFHKFTLLVAIFILINNLDNLYFVK